MFLIVESAIFHLGWYNKYLEPHSSAGMVEGYLYWLGRFRQKKVPEILVMGDSRIAEGFSAREAGLKTLNRFRFWSFGLGGSNPRIWYYVLRDADPTRQRFAAIVLPLSEYADVDRWDNPENHLIDLNYLIGRLRVSDCADFASSMSLPEYQAKALTGCLFRGIALRRDAQEFLQDVPGRIARAEDYRVNGLFYVDNYAGRTEDLRGLSVDFAHRTIQFPPGLTAERSQSIEAMEFPVEAPQKGQTTRYRKRWLGRILDLYKDSPTRIVFLEMPRAPIPTPESDEPERFLKWALKRPRISALPEGMFRELERPEVFFDGLHLNRLGRGLFSEKVAAQIPPLTGIR